MKSSSCFGAWRTGIKACSWNLGKPKPWMRTTQQIQHWPMNSLIRSTSKFQMFSQYSNHHHTSKIHQLHSKESKPHPHQCYEWSFSLLGLWNKNHGKVGVRKEYVKGETLWHGTTARQCTMRESGLRNESRPHTVATTVMALIRELALIKIDLDDWRQWLYDYLELGIEHLELRDTIGGSLDTATKSPELKWLPTCNLALWPLNCQYLVK